MKGGQKRMAGDREVKAVIKADATQYFSTMKQATSDMRTFGSTAEKGQSILKSMFSANILSGAVMSGISTIKEQFSGLIGEMNSSSKAWATFEGNLKAFDKSTEYIADAKKQMQDYAELTIYSASDMANTFAQLEAVGVKDTATLVKAFGGLASSAENPKQAMKSLSMQATQMAAKPKVAWMDFKIMLEQAPAGIAGVAKAMGKTTEQLIADVQDKKVTTQEFFDAMKEAAGSEESAFQKMAMQYKTADQALDGLRENLSNKLQPAFKELDNIAIEAISGIIENMDKIDVTAITDNIKKFLDVLSKVKETIMIAFQSGKKIVQDFISGFEQSGALQNFLTAISKVKVAIEKVITIISQSDIWKTLGTYIGELVKFFSDLASAVADFINNCDPEIIKNITTVVVGLIAGFIAFKTVFGIVEKVIGVFGIFKSKVVGAVSGTVSKVSGVATTFVKIFNALGKNISKIITALAKGLSTVAKGIGTAIATIIKSLVLVPPTTLLALSVAILAIGGAFALMGTQGAGIAEILRGFADGVGILLQAVASTIGILIQSIAQALPIISQSLVALIPFIQTVIDSIVLIITTVVNGIVTLAPVIVEVIAQIVEAISVLVLAITPIIQTLSTAIVSIVSVISGAISHIVSVIGSIFGQIAPIINSVANVIRSLGEVISTVLSGAQGIIQSFGGVISSVFSGANSVVESFGNVVRSVLDGIAGIIDSVGNAFEKFGTAIEKIGNVALQLPVAAAGILALSVAIAGMGASSWAGNLVGVSNDLATLGNVVTILNNQTTGFVSGLNMLSSGFSSISSGVMMLSSTFTTIATVIPVIVTAFQSLSPATQGVVTNLATLSANTGVFVTSLAIINNGVTAFISSMTQISTVSLMVQMSLQTVANSSEQVTNSLSRIVGILPQISSGFSGIGNSVNSAMSGFINSISSAVLKAQSTMMSGMTQMASIVELSGNKIVTMARVIGQQMTDNISKGVSSGVVTVNASMTALITAVVSTGTAGVSRMQTVGYMIGQGLAVGMRRALNEVTASANALVQQAEKAVKAKAQIHSPSRLFRDEVGIFIGQGIAVGIDRSQKDVTSAMTDVLDSITSSTADIDDIITGSLSSSVTSSIVQDVVTPNNNEQILDALSQALNRDIVVEVNGKQLVKAVGKDIDEYQNRNVRNNKLLKGDR